MPTRCFPTERDCLNALIIARMPAVLRSSTTRLEAAPGSPLEEARVPIAVESSARVLLCLETTRAAAQASSTVSKTRGTSGLMT